MEDFIFARGGAEMLDGIEPLWRGLNEHHRERAGLFATWFARFTFTERRRDLLRKTGSGSLLVELARESGTGAPAGYCVSSVDGEGKGEIESIYIQKEYRGRGLGGRLLQDALDWLEHQEAGDIKIVVACGNEEALGFYARYGFHPRTYVLRRPPAETSE